MATVPVSTCLRRVNWYTYTDADVTQLRHTVSCLHVRFCSPTQFHTVHFVQKSNASRTGTKVINYCVRAGGEPGYEASHEQHPQTRSGSPHNACISRLFSASVYVIT